MSGPYGVYLHVPWCRARCPYCAFYVVPERGLPPWRPFVERALREYRWRRQEFAGPAATVFFGGGTPSRMPAEAFTLLLAEIEREPGAEVSIEVNPEDLSPEWLEGVLRAGITRVSLGVQSLQAGPARRLGRAHTSAAAEPAIARVARSGVGSWSADLVFAVPEQTEALLWRDLDQLLSHAPPHVSLYGLTIEPDTRFGRVAELGRLPMCDEDLFCAMYEGLVQRLQAAGLARYEVSNFAREGHRCRHNQLYWTDAPYMGLGPSAHGYAPSTERWVNVADLGRYLAQDDPTETRERPTPQSAATDLWISGLRAIDGLDLEHLRLRTGLQPDEAVLQRLIDGGWVQRRGSRVSLTHQGFPVSDTVIARLVDATR
jgi:oxygen-independent coproporphyrinogen-3 oxidase